MASRPPGRYLTPLVVAVGAFDGFGIAAQTISRIQHDKTVVIEASDVPAHQAALAANPAHIPLNLSRDCSAN